MIRATSEGTADVDHAVVTSHNTIPLYDAVRRFSLCEYARGCSVFLREFLFIFPHSNSCCLSRARVFLYYYWC